MNKKKAIITVVLCCAAIVAISAIKNCKNISCFNKEYTIITIEATQEAKEQVEKMMADKPQTDAFFKKALAPNGTVYTRKGKQTLPKVEMKYTPEVSECKGENVYTISKPEYDKIVIYIHGGAFLFEISPKHVAFCDKLVDTLNAKVIMPLYPLAPQAKLATAYEMLTEVYKEALKENKPVYLIGDSAGANFSLGLAMHLKEEKLTAPAKVVAMSPCANATITNKEIPEYEAKDPMFYIDTLHLCMEHIDCGEKGLKDYHISPIYGDLNGLPDILLFAGTREAFYPDLMLLADKLKEAGNKTQLVIGDGLPHVFPICIPPTCEQSLAVIKQFIEGK